MKKWCDWGKIWTHSRGDRGLGKADFVDRLDNVLIVKRALAGFCGPDAVAISLYLEMPEQVGRTQRSGKYCRTVCRWIPCT